MLDYITLALVVIKYALDFIAPRTKNKVDDTARDVADKLPLPSLPSAAQAAAEQAGLLPKQGSQETRDSRENPPKVESRDHRTVQPAAPK